MCPLRCFFIFFILGLASLASGLPILDSNALGPVYPRAVILKGQEVDARSVSVRSSLKERPWDMFPDPEHAGETYITLINASPYEWQRGRIHEHQMRHWPKDFPKVIKPGDSVSVLIQPSKTYGNWEDSAAEVEYLLVDTSEPMSFMVKFNNRDSSSLKVEFLGALSSMNNAMGSVHDLEIAPYPGGSAFILAGEEGDFITNDPPINWMQAMLPELKDKPLREILLGMSHHSGLWSIHRKIGAASAPNTQTQTVNLREQLGNGGIRVLDFRPLKIGDEFREVHGTRMKDRLGPGIIFHGAEGASLSEMIQVVNEFNREYPGELIIWDVNSHDAWNKDHQYRELKKSQEDRMALYKQFLALENRVNIPDDVDDVSKWPLGRFIGNKTSAVLIKFDENWREMDIDVFPGNREGFVTCKILPHNHRWSETDNVKNLVGDQVSRFQAVRQVPQSPIHIADWVLTLSDLNAALPIKKSIMSLALSAWRALFDGLWPLTTSDSYPNWVSVDNVRGNQHKTLVMAMNHCLVAKKCGDLSGKVST